MWRFRRASASARTGSRINIGADNQRLAGWLNTDVSWRAPLYLDALKPWPTPPGSVTHVYADNVIEHFTLAQARRFLANAHAALERGGRIRLATPDVERTARVYLEGGEMADKHMQRHRHVGYSDVEHQVDLLRVTFAAAGHHLGYMWDLAALSSELTRAGFVNLRRCEVGESADLILRGLEGRTGETEAATTLVVEGSKTL